MADDHGVTPGAALADPALQAALERWRGNKDDLQTVRHVLARFPWREYQYKYGRWEWVGRLFDFGFPLKKWARTYDTVLLLDPVSAQPAGELRADRLKLRKYSGTVRFAGDPRVGGVLSATGEDLQFVVTPFAGREEVIGQLQVLRPGGTPPLDFLRYLHEPRDENRPWVSDHLLDRGAIATSVDESWMPATLPSASRTATRPTSSELRSSSPATRTHHALRSTRRTGCKAGSSRS